MAKRSFAEPLPESLRQKLRDALASLRVSQERLTKDRSGGKEIQRSLSQGFVSNLMSGKPISKVDKVGLVVNGIREVVKQRVSEGGLAPAEANRIHRLADDLEAHFGLRVRSRRPLPGETITRDTLAYIDREVTYIAWRMSSSTSFERILSSVPLAMCIYGPIQSGLTSYMRNLTHEMENVGIEVLLVDAKMAGRFVQDPEVLAEVILRELGHTMADLWDFAPISKDDNPVKGSQFATWLVGEARRKPHRGKRLIAIDGLPNVPKEAGLKLLDILRTVAQRGANYNVPSSLLCLPYETPDSNELIYSSKKFAIGVEVDWFTEGEVQQFCNTLLPETLEEAWRDLYAYFGGQPYLTHVCVQLLEMNAPVADWPAKWEEIKKTAEIGEGAFDTHHTLLVRGLQGLERKPGKILHALCNSKKQVLDVSKYDPLAVDYLVESRLVDRMDPPTPASATKQHDFDMYIRLTEVPYYRAIAKQLAVASQAGSGQ